MATSKSNFWSSPLTRSRITSDDVKMPEKVPPDKKTSWGKRERYSFGYAVFLILALMK